MLIIFDDATVLNVDKIEYMTIGYTPETKKILKSNFLGLFPIYERQEIPAWTLTFKYTHPEIIGTWTYTNKNSDYERLKISAKQIIVQIRRFDPTLINTEFEEAFFKE